MLLHAVLLASSSSAVYRIGITSSVRGLARAKRLQELAQTLHVHCRVVDGYALGDCVPMTTNKPYAQVGTRAAHPHAEHDSVCMADIILG